MKVNWKGVLSYILLAVVWIAYGLSKGAFPQLAAFLPLAAPVLVTAFHWLGVSSPQMPPLLAMFRKGPSVVPAVFLALALGDVTACSWLQSTQGGATVKAGVDLAICVLNHSSEPVAQIVTDCGASTAEDVIKILDAHKAATVRDAAKDAGQ